MKVAIVVAKKSAYEVYGRNSINLVMFEILPTPQRYVKNANNP